MKESVKSVVVLIVAPPSEKYRLDHVLDSLSSVLHYSTPSRRIIVLDNSERNLADSFYEAFPEVIVLRTSENYGLCGGLYKSLSLAMLHAYTAYDFDLLIRMDTDSLMTGSGVEDEAIRLFRQQPNVGQLGTYLIGANGEPSEFAWPRQQLQRDTSLLGWLKDRERALFLRDLIARARAYGYQLGEHVLGGASIFSYAVIEKFLDHNLLLREEMHRSNLQEDHIFSLLVKAVGMDLGDFGGPDQAMAVRWRGLPRSPESLIASGKKIIHSTRFWQDVKEDDIREFFRAQRNYEYADREQP
jgi:hypothetical protein